MSLLLWSKKFYHSCNKMVPLCVNNMKGQKIMITLIPLNTTDANIEKLNIDELLKGVSQGDTAAFEALYNCMKTSVYSYAYSVLRNVQDAEDILHDCFIHIYAAANTYQRQGKAKAWIITITRNLCMQRLRERKKLSDFSIEDTGLHITEPAHLSPEDKLVLEQCLRLLSDEERQIVILHAVSGFKHREIASLLDIPLPTVLSKYNRAIKKLKKII